MGLALANLFQPNTALLIWVPVLAAVVAAVTVAMARWVRFPFLAAPFIGVFWLMWPFADSMGLVKIDFGAFPDAPVAFGKAVVAALGATLFASGPIVGLVFLAGVLVSNWRHAVVALIGAALAASLAAFVGAKGTAINSGFIGFNAVLGAMASYALVAADRASPPGPPSFRHGFLVSCSATCRHRPSPPGSCSPYGSSFWRDGSTRVSTARSLWSKR